MRATVDIRDEVFAALQAKSVSEGTTVGALVEEALVTLLKDIPHERSSAKRRELPSIGRPCAPKLHLDHDRVNELLS